MREVEVRTQARRAETLLPVIQARNEDLEMSATGNQMILAMPLAFVLFCVAAAPLRVSADESSEQSGPAAVAPAHRTAALPPLMQLLEGTPVRTRDDWTRRKAEIRRLLCETFCGTFPEEVPPIIKADVLQEQEKEDGSTRRRVKLTFDTKNHASFEMWVWIPRGKGPFPVLLTQPRYYQLAWAELALSRGYLVGLYPGVCYTHRQPGYPGYEGVYRTFQREYPEATWSSIATKAWLAGRALDYLLNYHSGYNEGYGVQGTTVYHRLAQEGFVVLAYDQCGFGLRLLEGRDFYKEYPRWSKLGRMVHDVRAAVDFLAEGRGVANGDMPAVDKDRIYVLGYSLGGSVGLYATALDDRIAGVASFCGFTPMRTDTDKKFTGGLRRFWEWHSLQPLLGLFHGREQQAPYDFDDVLGLIAPRPCLVYSPKRDREADYEDVAACVERARQTWKAHGRGDNFTHQAPDDINRFQADQQNAFLQWAKGL